MYDPTTDIDFIEARIKEQENEILNIISDTKASEERKAIILDSAESQLHYFIGLKSNIYNKNCNLGCLN